MTDQPVTLVEVNETLTGRYTQHMRSGRHTLTADEPESASGDDAGPGPYDYLLMALGACTSMTLRMYAEHKQLPLKRVQVRLSHRKIHAQDCRDCERLSPCYGSAGPVRGAPDGASLHPGYADCGNTRCSCIGQCSAMATPLSATPAHQTPS